MEDANLEVGDAFTCQSGLPAYFSGKTEVSGADVAPFVDYEELVPRFVGLTDHEHSTAPPVKLLAQNAAILIATLRLRIVTKLLSQLLPAISQQLKGASSSDIWVPLVIFDLLSEIFGFLVSSSLAALRIGRLIAATPLESLRMVLDCSVVVQDSFRVNMFMPPPPNIRTFIAGKWS